MKNRVFVALLLAVVLALPAVAQQSGSTTQDQPAASQPATSQSTGTATQDQPAASQPAQSAPAAQADQHAIDAGNKAQMAQQTATQANTRLTTVEQVVGNIDQYKAANQTEIRFRPGQTVLSKNAKAALDDMATPLKNQRGYIIEVQGFSSGRGTAAIQTSQKMADSVVRYLVLNHEIPVYRIYVVGMG